MELRGDRAWREEWRALDKAARRHIEGEVRSARPLAAYDEARLAVGCARHWRRRAVLGAVLVFPLLTAGELVASSVRDGTMSWGYVGTLSIAVIVATMAFTIPKTRRAEAANGEVVARGPGQDRPAGSALEAIRHATGAPAPGHRPGGARPAPRKPPAPPG